MHFMRSNDILRIGKIDHLVKCANQATAGQSHLMVATQLSLLLLFHNKHEDMWRMNVK